VTIRWVPDPSGRFDQRPHYDLADLDRECDQIITDFLMPKYGEVPLPIPTDELTKLIERDALLLDLYADLSGEGPGVEGVTYFDAAKKPIVKIAQELSEESWREHRLRTTLTHEYGHVHFHNFLYALPRSLPLFPTDGRGRPLKCKRETIIDAPPYDWMEWQAGYVCGALLMPITDLAALVRSLMLELDVYHAASVDSPQGVAMIGQVAQRFDVSVDAARVRLSRLGYLTRGDVGSPLPN
jgi:hypothetical protein